MRRADRLLQIIQVMRRARGPVSGGAIARELGFAHVRSGPLVRSSYHAAG